MASTSDIRACGGSSNSRADYPRKSSGRRSDARRDAMVDVKGRQESGTRPTAMMRGRHVAWLVIVIADAGILLWGAMAALAPEHLLGPGSAPILPAGYEGFTGRSWS